MELFASLQFQLQILGHVALAMALGALIGIEREAARRPAGLRTHMLVSGSAVFFVLLGAVIVEHFQMVAQQTLVRSDPIRVLEAVITGISFLGAGTIIRGGSDQGVRGLTTAASILVAAGIGVAVALSQFLLALGSTVLVLIALRGLGIAERKLGLKEADED